MLDGAGRRGFGISRNGTNPGAVSTLDICKTSVDAGMDTGYPHAFIATKPNGNVCKTDPKVKILD